MYELIILSLLMRFSLNGYAIAKIANDIIGPWAKVSNGTLYPLLTKLEKAGLIELTNGEQGTARAARHGVEDTPAPRAGGERETLRGARS